jgi:hypothetical protein
MRILSLATATVLVAVSVAACGSKGSGVAVSSSPTPGTAAKEAKARQFVDCARKNGVPNVSDPSVDGQGNVHISPPPGLTKESPIVQHVLKVCGSYLNGVLTDGGNGNPAQNYDRALKMSKCIRQHGVPNFPDPSPPSGNEGPKIQVQPGINQQALQQAMKACGANIKHKS